MRPIAFFSTMLILALATLQVNAQVNTQENVKKEIKEVKKEIKETKKEIKENKKTPRTELKAERKVLQNLRGEVVNVLSKDQFYADFGNIDNVQWIRTKYFDEASFEKDGVTMKAYYDIESKLVGTTTPKTFADLPANSQKEIKSKYSDYTIDKIILFNDNEANETDMMLYGIQFEDADHYFVELTKDKKAIVLMVSKDGLVTLFTDILKTPSF